MSHRQGRLCHQSEIKMQNGGDILSAEGRVLSAALRRTLRAFELTAREWTVLDAVISYSYESGFEAARIEVAELARETGIKVNHLYETFARLAEKGICDCDAGAGIFVLKPDCRFWNCTRRASARDNREAHARIMALRTLDGNQAEMALGDVRAPDLDTKLQEVSREAAMRSLATNRHESARISPKLGLGATCNRLQVSSEQVTGNRGTSPKLGLAEGNLNHGGTKGAFTGESHDQVRGMLPNAKNKAMADSSVSPCLRGSENEDLYGSGGLTDEERLEKYLGKEMGGKRAIWRMRLRECPVAVRSALDELKLRLAGSGNAVKSRGGFLTDEYWRTVRGKAQRGDAKAAALVGARKG